MVTSCQLPVRFSKVSCFIWKEPDAFGIALVAVVQKTTDHNRLLITYWVYVRYIYSEDIAVDNRENKKNTMNLTIWFLSMNSKHKVECTHI